MFGPYRETAATVRRPRRKRFAPTYTIRQSTHERMAAIHRLDAELRNQELATDHAHRLLRQALVRNAYGTASIEGNPLSLQEVEALLDQAPLQALQPDEQEILNHWRLIQDPPSVAAPEDLLRLHKELFDGVLTDAGQWKTSQNFVGKRPELVVTFVPAEPERVLPELRMAFDWFHRADESPLVRALVFFHELESIHPFRDGNGRVGRFALQVHLRSVIPSIRYGYLDYAMNADPDPYYQELNACDASQDYTAWIEYMVGLVHDALVGARRRFLLLDDLAGNARQVQVAEWLARQRFANDRRRLKFADVHAAFPTVAERTLKRDLARLRDQGLLEVEGTGKGTTYRFARRP
jgi:Fic family protein